jgi:hypothetical protein
MENVNQQEQEQELTPEQLTERKEQMLSFYKESIPYLEAQLNYENLLTSIDEVRFKRTNIQMQYAMLASEMQEGPEEETTGPTKRTLKKK